MRELGAAIVGAEFSWRASCSPALRLRTPSLSVTERKRLGAELPIGPADRRPHVVGALVFNAAFLLLCHRRSGQHCQTHEGDDALDQPPSAWMAPNERH